tara:strand:+ start:515 stop:1318 length:804 start_codon:yes stop_codon:yes gene_type:complete
MSGYISNIIDLSNIITSFRCNEKKNDSQVLDPFSCLVRLCLLNYKPSGTKLSFTNNKIVFQEPDFLQSAKRWSSGDSRQHIHNLYNPIFKLNQWYNINTPQFIYLLNKSKSGLNQLLKCYNNNDSNLISHSINYYIETIDKTLENKIIDDNEKLNNNDEKSNNNDEKSNNNDVNTKKKTNKNTQNKIINVDDNIPLSHTTDIYSIKLKNLWNLDEINIIYLLLLEIEKKFNADKFNNSSSLIMCIEEILYGKDEILNNIVNKISTSL